MLSVSKEADQRVLDRIESACSRSGRSPEEITIVGVTKGHPREVLSKARALGLREIGENRVQETLDKYGFREPGSADSEFRLHLLGHLQRNKVKRAVELFDSIDTVDDVLTAEAVDRQAGLAGKRVRVLIQVNTSREIQKSGVAPERAGELVSAIMGCENIDLQGFMTIGPLEGDDTAVRRSFRDLRMNRDRVCQELKIHELPVLSMGMSGDFEMAIEEGATEIRLGTILWGPREA